jgi:glycerol-3-phosphate dehydrogenase
VLTFFADDGRLFFVIPMGPRTCIGTTDTKVETPSRTVTAEDRAFVLSNINKRLRLDRPLTEADIIAERCGVRPLATEAGSSSADWVQLSRKHLVEVDHATKHVSIFGGKLTDCLNVGDEICAEIQPSASACPTRSGAGTASPRSRHATSSSTRPRAWSSTRSPRRAPRSR